MALRYNEVEVLWAGRSRIMMGSDENRLGGPDPEVLAEELGQLRYLLAAGPIEWVEAPLGQLLAAVMLAKAEVERVHGAGEKLRRLGLGQTAAAGADPAKDYDSGEFMQAVAKSPPADMEKVLRARMKEEKPVLPVWLGPASGPPDVRLVFGDPDGDALDALGPMALHERLSELEEGRDMAQARFAWVRDYEYGPSYMMQEQAAVAEYGRLLNAATQAFNRSRIPNSWSAPEIPRRLFDRIALGNPPLAADMMARVPATVITEK